VACRCAGEVIDILERLDYDYLLDDDDDDNLSTPMPLPPPAMPDGSKDGVNFSWHNNGSSVSSSFSRHSALFDQVSGGGSAMAADPNLMWGLLAKGGADEIKSPAFLSHFKAQAGDAARIFVDTARSIVYESAPLKARQSFGRVSSKRLSSAQDDDDDSFASPGPRARHFTPPNVQTLTNFQRAHQRLLELVAPTDLIFLDSTSLSNLHDLLTSVEQSSTYLLLLTREVFNRPWVLAELCVAHTMRKRIIPIGVDWPGTAKLERDFRFPLDIDTALEEWRYYQATLKKNEQAQEAHVARRSTVGEERLDRVFSGAGDDDVFKLHREFERLRVRTWWRLAQAFRWLQELYVRIRDACSPPPPAAQAVQLAGSLAGSLGIAERRRSQGGAERPARGMRPCGSRRQSISGDYGSAKGSRAVSFDANDEFMA
jgi:hypothetical protein